MEKHITKRGKKKKSSNGLALGIRCALIIILLIIWQLIAANNVKICILYKLSIGNIFRFAWNLQRVEVCGSIYLRL